MNNLKDKEQKLDSILREQGSVLVAYSGGVDSTYLLKMALEVLGKDKVLAVTAKSESYPDDEISQAVKLATSMGSTITVIKTNELYNEKYV
ncbi:MAG: TIGR00268 family protein, partial [Actinobacteria bacterium]